MAIPVFAAAVDAHAKLDVEDRSAFSAYLAKLKGKSVEIIVRPKRAQRSLDQNSYIHAVPIPLIAEHCGMTIPEAKYELMGACWGWKTLPSGHEIPIKGHTSEMTVEECTRFIDWVIPWAMTEHKVAIPLPNEADWEAA